MPKQINYTSLKPISVVTPHDIQAKFWKTNLILHIFTIRNLIALMPSHSKYYVNKMGNLTSN